MKKYYCEHCKVFLARADLIEQVETDAYEIWGAPVDRETLVLHCPTCADEVQEAFPCTECGNRPPVTGADECAECADVLDYVNNYSARRTPPPALLVFEIKKTDGEQKAGMLSAALKLSGMLMLSRLFGAK